MELLYAVLFAATFATSLAEVADFRICNEVSSDLCTVSAVRITPCNKKKEKCILFKGTDTSISFDFTPNFAASKVHTEVYWVNNQAELRYAGFGSNDACLYTKCPLEAGQQQTLNYNLHLGKKLPKGHYPLKWKVWNEDDPTQLCCFMTTIDLRK